MTAYSAYINCCIMQVMIFFFFFFFYLECGWELAAKAAVLARDYCFGCGTVQVFDLWWCGW